MGSISSRAGSFSTHAVDESDESVVPASSIDDESASSPTPAAPKKPPRMSIITGVGGGGVRRTQSLAPPSRKTPSCNKRYFDTSVSALGKARTAADKSRGGTGAKRAANRWRHNNNMNNNNLDSACFCLDSDCSGGSICFDDNNGGGCLGEEDEVDSCPICTSPSPRKAI